MTSEVSRNEKSIGEQYIIALYVGMGAFGASVVFGYDILDGVAISVFFFSFALFIQRVGIIIPINELAFLLASLQWLLMPVLAYSGLVNPDSKFSMWVDKATYMPFAICGTLAFAGGLFLFDNKKQYLFRAYFLNQIVQRIIKQKELPYFLIIAGIIFTFVYRFLLGDGSYVNFGFLLYLLSLLKYIGLIYLLFSQDRKKWLFLFIGIFLTFLTSLKMAMFHELVLWIIFGGLYCFLVIRNTFWSKFLFIFLLTLFITLILMVKSDYREQIWGGYKGDKGELFLNVLERKLENFEGEGRASNSTVEDIVKRLNQGGIISRIMFYIPNKEPYLYGESVISALYAGIVPRLLDPDKQVAGGRDYFERFTGFKISASMGASLLGEGYANFGTTGAIVFLFIMGSLFCILKNVIYNLALKYPTLLLWLPFIFLQAVKAETDLLRIFTHLVKSTILLLFIIWVLRKQFRFQL